MYGQLEEADPLIEDLCRDKVGVVIIYNIAQSHSYSPCCHTMYFAFRQDPLLRRAGMFTIAMAYCGSGDNKAIRRLLHVAVS
jgi:26S proteasome regulatory subunit N2